MASAPHLQAFLSDCPRLVGEALSSRGPRRTQKVRNIVKQCYHDLPRYLTTSIPPSLYVDMLATLRFNPDPTSGGEGPVGNANSSDSSYSSLAMDLVGFMVSVLSSKAKKREDLKITKRLIMALGEAIEDGQQDMNFDIGYEKSILFEGKQMRLARDRLVMLMLVCVESGIHHSYPPIVHLSKGSLPVPAPLDEARDYWTLLSRVYSEYCILTSKPIKSIAVKELDRFPG